MNHILLQISPKQNHKESITDNLYSISHLAFIEKYKQENIGPILQCTDNTINLKFLETYLQPPFDRKDFLKLLFNYFPVWQRLALLRSTHVHPKLAKLDPGQQLQLQFFPQSLHETAVQIKFLMCKIVFHLGRAEPELYPEIRTLVNVCYNAKQNILKYNPQNLPNVIHQQQGQAQQMYQISQQQMQQQQFISQPPSLTLNINKFMELFEYNQRIKDQPYGKTDKYSANFAFRYNPSNFQDFDVIESFFVNLITFIYCNSMFKKIQEGIEKEIPKFNPESNLYKIEINFPELIVSYSATGLQLVKISYEIKQLEEFSISYEGFHPYLEQMLKKEKAKALEKTPFIAAVIYFQAMLKSGFIQEKVIKILEKLIEQVQKNLHSIGHLEIKRYLEIVFSTLCVEAVSYRLNLQMALKPAHSQQRPLICVCQILEDKLLILKNEAFDNDYDISNDISAEVFVNKCLFSQ